LIALFTVVSSQRKLPFTAGSSIAILGMGVTGLLHLQLAKLSGASRVIVTSRSPWKLDLAKRFKADVIINSKEEDPIEGIRRATGGRGVDVAIESTGGVETIRQSLKMARPGGVVLQYGIAAKPMDGLDLYPLYYRELTVIGSRAFTPRDVEMALELVRAGGFDLGPFVTHRFSLEKIAEGLEFVHGHPGDVLRAVIQV
jgi:threonine dehydrogenase-like Zn-dependent dehydrogenase